MIRILIADDQAIVRDGLKLIVSLETDMTVVATAENGEQAVTHARQFQPDLILMDINMPKLNGIEAAEKILEEFPDTKMLMLTTYETGDWLQAAIDIGTNGYLLKDTTREDLIGAIRGTLEGKNYIDPQIAGYLLQSAEKKQSKPPAWIDELNEREQAVLKLIGRGLTNPKIAETLHLSEGTVRNYVSTILTKLDVTDRTQAAILAVKHGLD